LSTIRELLDRCRDLDRLDTEVLLCETLGCQRAWLYSHDDHRPSDEQTQHFLAWAARRRQGEPVAYLIGWREFWSLRLRITPATLIPRPETELLVEQALARLPRSRPCRVLDLGTGSGAIALAIASERPTALVIAIDNSVAALEVARENASQLGLENVHCLAGDWYQPVASQSFDLIVSNPPYIRADDPHLGSGDAAHEPRLALTPGGDGLTAHGAIINGASAHLNTNGQLLLEHGYEQRDALLEMLTAAGCQAPECYDDLAGLPRVLAAKFSTLV